MPDAVGLLATCDDVYPDVPIERWDPFRPAYPELFSGAYWRLPVACTVIQRHGRTVLVDAGVGPPGGGAGTPSARACCPAALARGLGVDTVFFTHLHVDHVGWLADPELFERTRILVHGDALAYALEHSSVEWLPDVAHLRDAGRVETVAVGDDLLPGVRAVAYPGHYPASSAWTSRPAPRC